MQHVNKNKIVTTTAEEGKTLSIVGSTYRIVISGRQTGGSYAVIDMLIPPGGGPMPHSHPNFQESFYMLDGEVDITTEAGSFTTKKGSFVNIPSGGIAHQFKNNSSTIARLWCTVVPAGLEEFFEAIGKPVAPGTFLPLDHQPSVKELNVLQEIAEKHGQKILSPDYFIRH